MTSSPSLFLRMHAGSGLSAACCRVRLSLQSCTAFVVGHQAHSTSAAATNSLAAAHTMRAPVPQMAHKQQAVAQMAAQGVPHPAIKTQHLEEEEAAAEEKAEEPKPAPAAAGGEGGDDSIDLMPPKNIKGGKGKALESSIEEAFEDKPNPENSHYIADHTDKVMPFSPPSPCAKLVCVCVCVTGT